MIIFCIIKLAQWNDFSCYFRKITISQSGLKLHSSLLSLAQLRVIDRVNGGTVLTAAVVALPHALGRIMGFPKCPEQGLKTHYCRIIEYQHHFGVTGAAAANILIAGVCGDPTGIAHCGTEDPGQLPKQALGTPKAAEAKYCPSQMIRQRRHDWIAGDNMPGRKLYRLRPIRYHIRRGR